MIGPEEDDHLMDAYDDAQNGAIDDDWQSQFDDDPSPYDGTYSEE